MSWIFQKKSDINTLININETYFDKEPKTFINNSTNTVNKKLINVGCNTIKKLYIDASTNTKKRKFIFYIKKKIILFGLIFSNMFFLNLYLFSKN